MSDQDLLLFCRPGDGVIEEGNHGGGEAEGGLDGLRVDARGAGYGTKAGGGAIEADILGYYPHIKAAEAADTALLRLFGSGILGSLSGCR